MMITVLNALKQELANRVSSIQIESGELVLTPYDYPDGETVSLLVRQLDGDLYLVSDLGLAAARLDEAGVDITRGGGHRSWKLLTADLSAPAAEANEYEIAAVADEQSLGITMIRIGQAAIHSDALQAVHGRRRPHSFKERSMKRAAGFNLAVRPGAEIVNRYGGRRRLSFTAQAPSGRVGYVITIGTASGASVGHDRAVATFGEFTDVGKKDKLVLVDKGIPMQDWQIESLRDISSLYSEDEQDQLWREFAAA
ncbi:DUF1828 domain-containing protein [Propionibacterium acidifaciens]|uniref:DUF1828 domain-containing protein n=1 Tax=Propionibacterium acidifaciens TaxID=556499 RepID=UPI0028EEB1B6|nr:DUF1828 domain-containing protein [Propionibacterium acidifaciens]